MGEGEKSEIKQVCARRVLLYHLQGAGQGSRVLNLGDSRPQPWSVAMREWRILEPPTGSDHEYRVQCILLDDRGSSSMCSSPTVQRMTVELLIGWSSGKPLADDLRGQRSSTMATFSFQHLSSTLHLAMLTYTAHIILDST